MQYEESLRQFLILRRDALKGVMIEGMEINNLINSVLQDYAYTLKGVVTDSNSDSAITEIIRFLITKEHRKIHKKDN